MVVISPDEPLKELATHTSGNIANLERSRTNARWKFHVTMGRTAENVLEKSEPGERYHSIQVVCSNTPCNDQSFDRISSADLLKRNLESTGRVSSFFFDTSTISRLSQRTGLAGFCLLFFYLDSLFIVLQRLRFELINEFLRSPHQPSRRVSYLFNSPLADHLYISCAQGNRMLFKGHSDAHLIQNESSNHDLISST